MASPADRGATGWSERRLRGSGLAAFALLLAPLPLHAQPRESDAALEALIPDSAIDNPDTWVAETSAARSNPDGVLADPAGLVADAAAEALDPASPLAPLSDVELAWPDASDLPELEPLSPEPDIQLAQEAAEAELAAIGVAPGEEAPRLADAQVEKLGKGVELAFGSADFAAREAVRNRFAELSSLRRLRDDDDTIAQLARRARADRDLLLKTLLVYGYYDAEVYQSLGGLEPGDSGVAAASGDPAVASRALGAVVGASITAISPTTSSIPTRIRRCIKPP